VTFVTVSPRPHSVLGARMLRLRTACLRGALFSPPR
jgi:hypothetical protein